MTTTARRMAAWLRRVWPDRLPRPLDWRTIVALSVLVFGAAFLLATVGLKTGQDDASASVSELRLSNDRLRSELDCRSRVSGRLATPNAELLAAAARGLAVLTAGDDPMLAEVVRAELGDAGPAELRRQLVKALAAANDAEAAGSERVSAEADCRAEAIRLHPGG